MGYWKDVQPDSPAAADLATDAFFDLICQTAEINSDDQVVLDVGCGYGTNALYCIRHFQPHHVIGLNLSQVQLKIGQQLVTEAKLADKITLSRGSATDIPLPDGSVDKIVCIEAASHFNTREHFFQEAYRVLRPNGLLVLADYVIPPPEGVLQKTFLDTALHFLLLPQANVYNQPDYLTKLETSRIRTASSRIDLSACCTAHDTLGFEPCALFLSRSKSFDWLGFDGFL